MDNSFHNLLMVSQATIQKKLFANIKDTKLTQGQPKVLDFLRNNDGCVQKDIAASCQIDPATVTSLLLRMEEAELIVRKGLNGNRRSLHVYITKKGKDAANRVAEEFKRLETIAFDGLSLEEQTQFMDLFTKIYGNLSKLEILKGEMVNE